MLMWHIVLLPIAVAAHRRAARPAGAPSRHRPALRSTRLSDEARGGHGAAPRSRHESRRAAKRRRFNPDRDVKEWKGAYVPYDILKEAFVAFLAVAVLIVLLAVVFSSPDEPAVTLKTWSAVDPVDFAQTRSPSSTGRAVRPPTARPTTPRRTPTQHIGFFEPAQWFGVHQPIDTAQDFVIGPLRTLPNQPLTQAALNRYTVRSAAQQAAWTTAYEKAVANATDVHGRLHVPAGATMDPSASSSVPSPPWRRPAASTAPS